LQGNILIFLQKRKSPREISAYPAARGPGYINCSTGRIKVSTGFFTNHKTGETIRVPNAGCARFWIGFALGNWLLPEMKSNSLDLLPMPVVDAAHKALSMRFTQGCYWG
jgi:hypothetical protein